MMAAETSAWRGGEMRMDGRRKRLMVKVINERTKVTRLFARLPRAIPLAPPHQIRSEELHQM